MPIDKIDKIYDAMVADGAAMPERDKFKKKMLASGEEGYKNRKDFYDAMVADGADLGGSYEAFAKKIGLHAKPKPIVEVGNMTPWSEEPTKEDAQAVDTYQQQIAADRKDGYHIPIRNIPDGFSVEGDFIKNPITVNGKQRTMGDVANELYRTYDKAYRTHRPYQYSGYGEALQKATGELGLDEDTAKQIAGGVHQLYEQNVASDIAEELYRRMDKSGDPLYNAQKALYDKDFLNSFYDHVASLGYKDAGVFIDRAFKPAFAKMLETKFNGKKVNADVLPTTLEGIRDKFKYFESQKTEEEGLNNKLGELEKYEKALNEDIIKRSDDITKQRIEEERKKPWLLRILDAFARGEGMNTNSPEIEQKLSDLRGESSKLRAMHYAIKDARNTQKAANMFKRGNSFLSQIGKGALDRFTDVRAWDFGLTDMGNNMATLAAVKNYEKGKASSTDEKLLEAIAIGYSLRSHNQDAMSNYDVGSGAVDSAFYGLTFIATPYNGLGGKLAQQFEKYAFKRFGAEAIKSGVLGKMALAIGKKSSRMAGDLVFRPIITTAMYGSAHIAADASNRQAGNIGFNDNGSVEINGKESNALTALAKATGALYIENMSEGVSDFIPGSRIIGKSIQKGIGKTFGKKAYKTLQNWGEAFTDAWTKVGTNEISTVLEQARKRAKLGDLTGEYTEEIVGGIGNALVIGDQTLDTQEGTGVFNTDNMWQTLKAISVPVGTMNAVQYGAHKVFDVPNHFGEAARYEAKERMLRKQVRAQAILGDKWQSIKDIVDGTDGSDDSDFGAKMSEATRRLNPEAKKAVVDYVVARGYYNGANMQSLKENLEGLSGELAEAYKDGTSLVDKTEMCRAKIMYDESEKRLHDILGVKYSEELPSDEELKAMLSDTAIRPEIADRIQSYEYAKAQYYGMIERVQTNLDMIEETATAEAEAKAHKQTNQIIPATMKLNDRSVYIVDGDIVKNDDGTINKEKSSDSIMIKDAESGKAEMVSPSAILSVEQPVELQQVIDDGISEQKQAYAAQEADKIDGKLDFMPNDQFYIFDNDKQQHEVLVVDRVMDEETQQIVEDKVIVSIDGARPTIMSKEELQDMHLADVANDVNNSLSEANEQVDTDADTADTTTEEPIEDVNTATTETDTTTEEPTEATEEEQTIPTDENGQPIYEQAEPTTAWNAIVEQCDGDVEIAQTVANDMVADMEAALKKAEKAKPKGGATVAEKIASEKERKAVIEQAKANLEHWKKIANVNFDKTTKEKIEQEQIAAQEAAARKAEQEARKAEQEEAERQKREALNGVPNVTEDTASDARARGYRRVDGDKVDRQEPINAKMGKEVNVKFDDDNIPTGHIAIIEADELQPSHNNGRRNPLHFIDEAQPKERIDDASKGAARKIASKIRPEEITTSITAYTGAPTVNSRGEVIQGNNRSAALKEMWSGYQEQADKYKQYLIEHADELGLSVDDIKAVKHPVLVNMLNVTDDEAIKLGQFVASDTESGGTERIKPKNVVKKLGEKMRNFANILLDTTDEDMTFAELIDKNGLKLLQWLSVKGIITPTQYKSAFDTKGNLTAEAKNDIKGTMYQSIFEGGSTQLEEMFATLPAKAQKAILATAYRDFDSPSENRMIEDIQESIMAFYALSHDEAFMAAKNHEDARMAVEAWKRQYAFDDATGESYLPSERFSNFALLLAVMYKGDNQRYIQSKLINIYDLIQGTQPATLFGEPDNTPRTLEQAIRETLNIEHDGKKRSNVLVGNNTTSQRGRQGSNRDATARGQSEEEDGAKDHQGGIDGDSIEGQPVAEDYIQSNTQADNGEYFYQDANGNINLAEIPDVVFDSIEKKKAPFRLTPSMLKHVIDRHGKEMGLSKADDAINFVLDVMDNFDHVRQGEKGAIIFSIENGRNRTGRRAVTILLDATSGEYYGLKTSGYERIDGLNKKPLLWEKGAINTSTTGVAPVNVTTEKAQQGNKLTGSASNLSNGSVGKDTQSSDKKQEKEEKVSPTERKDGEDLFAHAERVAKEVQERRKRKAEEEKVDTNPTEAQKEAGNYKKGHIKVDGMDITIEQPKGSVRRGRDADGKEWESKMHNTYGYIRGTESVDGDHIDIFLSDNPNEGSVFVVDQVNNDGSFDEHKVMYGFADMESAKQAYLSNYEEGWQGLGNITEVSKEDFRKWIDSSKRKTKPFAEYSAYAKETPKAEDKPKDSNSLVSDERMEELKRRLREKLRGQLNMGVDPELLAIGTEIAVGYIERGVTKFGEYAKVMIADLGDVIRPYLKAFYNGARDMPEMVELSKDMTPYNEVSSFNVATIGKEGEDVNPSILDTAEQISNEATVESNVQQDTKNMVETEDVDNDTYSITKQHNNKKNIDIWVVRGKERTDKDVYMQRKQIAKEYNGYYSSFRGVNGFVFNSPEDAQAFADKVFNTENNGSYAQKSEEIMRTDNQGNPIDKDGKLIIEKVGSISDLTDEDFEHPTRSVELPAIPQNIDEAIGANGKPVVIKKNIFEKNKQSHSDLTPAQSRDILQSALYNADLYGQNQKAKRPYNWIVINTKDKTGNNRLVLLEVNDKKDNVEIVHWHYIREAALETIKRQAEREGGLILILPSDISEEAGGLSSRTQDLSSAGKDTQSSDKKQENLSENDKVNLSELKDFAVRTDSSKRTIVDEAAFDSEDLTVPLLVDGKPSRLSVATIVPYVITDSSYQTAVYDYSEEIDEKTNSGWQKWEDLSEEYNSQVSEGERASVFGDSAELHFSTVDAAVKFNDWIEGRMAERQVSDATLRNDTEAKQLATNAVLDALDNAGISVQVVSDETASQMLGGNDAKADSAKEEDLRIADHVQFMRTSGKKKSASETASPDNQDQPTVVSSADGANILKSLDSEIKKYENVSSYPKTFIGDVSKALGAKRQGSASEYASFETKSGKIVTIRLSNHNAKVSTFDIHNEVDGISIVVTPKENNGIANDGNAHVTEFYYNAIKLRRADGKPLVEILKSIKQSLYSGEYNDTTGLAEVQEVNVSTGSNGQTEGSTVYGWTVGGKIFLTKDGINPNTPIHEYTHLWACAMRQHNAMGWQSVKDLLKGTPIWNEVLEDPNYRDISADEDAVASEALSRISGTENAKKMEAEAQRMIEEADSIGEKAEAVSLLDRMRRALDAFWRWAGKNLFKIRKFESIEEVTDRVLYDLTTGTDLDSDRSLMAVHNISVDKLQSAFELSGFPMPSIAITNANMGHSGYGDISLVFGKESIDPSSSRNKVYSGDAWTPMFPQIGYKLNDKKTNEIYKRANEVGSLPLFNPVYFHPDNYERKIDRRGDAALIDCFKEDYGAKQMYLAEKGNAVRAFVQHEVQKYSPEKVSLYKKILETIGLERLKNDSLDSVKDDLTALGFNGKSPKYYERIILCAIDYAEHGNSKIENDIDATEQEIDKRIDGKSFSAWLKQLFDGVVEKKGIRNERDMFTPSGSSRKWESLYDAVTLDNVIKNMRGQAEKGGSGIFNSSIFGASTKELPSIDAIRREAKLRFNSISNEKMEKAKGRIIDRLEKVSIPSVEKGVSDAFDFVENVINAVSKSHSPSGIYKYLHTYYPDMTMEAAKEISDIVSDIQKMSTRYFEAKPYRAVGFDEVRAAVVPNDVPKEIIDGLRKRGIKVVSYEKGNDQERKDALSSVTREMDIRFQIKGRGKSFDGDVPESTRNGGPTEEELIVERAKADGSYMKAPNGQPTKLTAKQWVQVRTKAFKEWFGDWERSARIEKLKNAESVEITGDEYKGKYELNRASAKNWIKDNLRGEYTITDTGEKVFIGRKGVNKVTSHSIGNDAHLKILVAVPSMLEKAIFITEEKAEKRNAQYPLYRYYVAGVNIGGIDYTVKLTIGVDENGNKYYDHALTEIEKGKLLDQLNDQAAVNGFISTGAKPNPSVTIGKDTKLLSILQTNSSKVLDENGEPKVLYHGTPNDFTTFDIDHLGETSGDRGLFGAGFYFNDVASYVEMFAHAKGGKGRVIATFLNLRNPYIVNNHTYEELLNHLGDGLDKGLVEGMRAMSKIAQVKVLVEGRERLFTDNLIKNGFDGVIANSYYYEPLQIVAFSANQIKSATENNGDFSKENDDILFRHDDSSMRSVASENDEKLAATTLQASTEIPVTNIAQSDAHSNLSDAEKDSEELMRDGDGAYSDDELSIINDPVAKILGRSTRSKRQREEFAKRERRNMAERVSELAKTLNLDNVEVITDTSGLQGRKAEAKGFYSKSNGKITVVVPNHIDIEDVEKTLLHEAVAHYGLRKLFGEHFDTFLDNVYQHAEEEIRKEIVKLAANNGWDFRTATEEYLAGLAENTNFENADYSFFTKIKELFLKMLNGIGFKNWRSVELSDNELRYLLWRSYENLKEPGHYRSILGEAADVAKQYELGVGNYAESESASERAAETSYGIEEVNRKFNEDLQKLNEDNADKVILWLGSPSNILLAAGVEHKPMKLYGNKVIKKMKKHGFALEELQDLPNAVANPIAVFDNYGREGNRTILTELRSQERNIMVAVTLGKNSVDVDFNIVSSVFGKGASNIVDWINNGYLTYVNKEKALNYLHFSERNISEASNNKELSFVAKIVKDFENPKIVGEKSVLDGKLLRVDKEKAHHYISASALNADATYKNELLSAAKIVKDFDNPKVSDDYLFRDGDEVSARDLYEKRVATSSYQAREALQDSMLGLKTAMDAVLKSEGVKKNIEDVEGWENAYLGGNRLSSVSKDEADRFARELFAPMLEEVTKLCKDKSEKSTLYDYMMAKHGLERNELMAQREGEKNYQKYIRKEPNGTKTEEEFIEEARNRDYAGLTTVTDTDNVADATDAAKKMVDKYEQKNNTENLWKKVNAVTTATLAKSYECGIINKETFDKISGMYKYYIPLRGFDEKTSSDAYAYITHPDSAFNAPVKTAKGRTSKADDPIANMQSMAESIIAQGNRNKLVKQKFLNFVLNHPSDLFSVNELWLEYNEDKEEWLPVFADNINDTDTPEEVNRKIEEFEEKMSKLAEKNPLKYKRGREAANIPYRVVNKKDEREHQIIVKRNGIDYVITVNGNPRAAQAVNGATNPDNNNAGLVGKFSQLGEKINRELSAFYTTRNPDFIISNFLRDMTYSNTMVWVKESPNYALRFNKNIAKCNPFEMKRLLARYRKGTLDMDDKTDNAFYHFMRNGGETGYANVRDIDKHKNDIRKELRRMNARFGIEKNVMLLAEQFDEVSRAIENSARFAAFLTSREFGRTIDRSIYDAKEISVNFNKKGSGSKFFGAKGQTRIGNIAAGISGAGRSLYVFWNAAIQGTTNFGRQAKRHPAKAFTMAATMFLLGATMASIGIANGDDDDDKNNYWNLPEYVRRSNITFKIGNQWTTIPLPVEYRALYGLGELMISSMSGKENFTTKELAKQIAGLASQVLPLDIMQDGGSLTALVPSAFKPMAEVGVNKSWTGAPIYKDTEYNKKDPEWTKAYKSANTAIVEATKFLNQETGGNTHKSGHIDFNPAVIEYLLNGYFSGVSNTVDRLSKMAEWAVGKREYSPRDFIFINRLSKKGDERTEARAVNNEYYRLKEEHDEVKKLLKAYEDDTYNGIFDYAEELHLLNNSEEFARSEIFDMYADEIKTLEKEYKEAETDEERKEIERVTIETKKMLIDDVNAIRK